MWSVCKCRTGHYADKVSWVKISKDKRASVADNKAASAIVVAHEPKADSLVKYVESDDSEPDDLKTLLLIILISPIGIQKHIDFIVVCLVKGSNVVI